MASRVLIRPASPVNDTNFPLQFHDRDYQPLSVEAVSAQLRVSRAFTRVCIAAGCPTRIGKVSAAELLHWLFEHYNLAREVCGFRRLAPVDGVAPEVAQRLKMGNAVMTLLEFGESRASGADEKRELRRVRSFVEQTLDRA
jgi:hypothetical protein